MSRAIVTLIVLCGFALFVAAGCKSAATSVNKDNYDKINAGMTQDEVEQILGKPTEEHGGGAAIGNVGISKKTVTWTADSKSITVDFVNNKMLAKSEKGL